MHKNRGWTLGGKRVVGGRPGGRGRATGWSSHPGVETLEPRQLLSGFAAPLADAPPVAADDHLLAHDAAAITGNLVLDDNGCGVDLPGSGGQPVVVTKVNGQYYLPGTPLELASGATLTIQPDGSFVYDPTTSPTLGAIAAGTEPLSDSFTYTVSAGYSGIYVFGDSMSDMGNLYELTGGLHPSEEEQFWEGRESNGPVWPEYFAPRLDLELTTDSNLAVAGATTGAYNVHESWFPADLPGLQDQINQFVGNVGGAADAGALHVVWAGPNNIFALESFDPDVVQNAIAQAMGEIAMAVGTLQQVGAEHIVVANMPDLSLTPWIVSLDSPAMTAGAQAISVGFNNALAGMLGTYFPDVVQIDVFGAFHQVVANPDAFGLWNVDQACYDGSGPVGDPNQYLFWNEVHPTTRGHQILADFFFQELMAREPLSLTDTADVQVAVSDAQTPVAFLDGNLYVGGTQDADRIYLTRDFAGRVHVRVNGQLLGVFELAADARVAVAGHEDDDWIGAGRMTASLILDGGDGHDRLFGGWGDDLLRGGAGNDLLCGRAGSDVLCGDAGDDLLYGGRGADVLFGGSGNDLLAGGRGADVLFGDAGNDWLLGQLGNDTLVGGDGLDWLWGGAGEDVLQHA